MVNGTNQSSCLINYQEVRCSFNGNDIQFEFFLLAIIQSLLGCCLLIVSITISAFYVKLKNDKWGYTSICTLELMIINVATSLTLFFSGITRCSSFSHSKFFCTTIYSSMYFFLLATFKTNFFMAFSRMYQLKFSSKMPWKKYLIAKLIGIILIIFCAFIPTTFELRHFRAECECTFNEILPNIYVIVNNCFLILMAFLTIICYVYIYFFVKSKSKKVGNTRNFEIVSSDCELPTATRKITPTTIKSNKIKVLRTQIILFFVLVVSYLPYIIGSMFKVVYNIEENTRLSTIINLLSLMMIFDLLLKPVLYTYRLKFMKKLYRNNAR